MIVTLAVVLGLVLVPGMISANPGTDCWLEIDPAVTKVGFNESFDVNVTFQNPTQQDINTIMCHINFTASLVEVTSVDVGATVGSPFPIALAGPDWNNTEGWLDYDGGILGGTTNVTSCVFATIHMKSKGATGIADIEFAPGTLAEPETQILDEFAEDHTDWASVVNGEVKCGAPQLTVDVAPAGKGDVKIDGSIPGSYPDVSSWSWDEVVGLEAIDSAAGWTFDSWSGDLGGGSATESITMSDAKSVTANFVELPAILDVDPNHLDLTARWGGYEDNDTVTISNTGGHTLCWALGDPPTWEVGDWWNYYNFYQPFPPLPIPGSNASFVNTSVVGGGNGSDYVCDVNIAPPLQRTMMGGMPCVLYSGSMVVDEYTLDIASQIGIMGIYPYGLPPAPEVPVQANLSWAYDSCHGWPYYLGKAWNYNLTMEVRTADGNWSPVDYKVIPAMAMVTDWNSTLSAWEITHLALPSMTPFMQTWWSPTAKNFVQQADGGTYDYPPMDVRSLVAFSTATPPAGPPAWLSFDKVAGALGIGGSEDLTVTANSAGLNVTTYNGSFTISAPGSIQSETVTVEFIVTPATTIDALRTLPADALDYDAEYPGMTFDVYVNFTAPVDEFNSIGLTDFAPAGWAVETNDAWCVPAASWNKSNYNKAEYGWAGPYSAGATFSAKYQVTIPATASPGLNEWPACMETCPACGESSPINDYCAWVEYWFGAEGPFESSICGDFEKIVTVPGCVVGETRDVNANPLDTVLVVLSEEPAEVGDEPEDSDSSTMTMYKNCADDTGLYYQVASKYCYYGIDTSNMPMPRNVYHPDYIDWSTPELLAAGYTMDFEGDYGLVCKAASMSYAMTSVNHWLFVPVDSLDPDPMTRVHPEWQLSSWKAMESVHSWQFPCGCSC